jgi:hypothetical protein
VVMNTEAYLIRADECLREAFRAGDADARQDWLRAAAAWKELAEISRELARHEAAAKDSHDSNPPLARLTQV